MAVRSTCLGFETSLPGAAWTVALTVPSGRTAIVRRWSVHNATSAAHTVTVAVRSGGVICRIGRVENLPANGTHLGSSDDLVLDAGHELLVSPATAGGPYAIHFHASGSLLLGEAE